MARTRKRFIAGAVCQECKAEDTLMLYEEAGKEHVECVSCGFKMSEPQAGSGAVPQAPNKAPAGDQVIGIFKP